MKLPAQQLARPGEQPSGGRRRIRRGPALAWAAGSGLGAAVVWSGAAAGLWFLPMAVGAAAGVTGRLSGRRPGIMAAAACLIAAAGWALPLAWRLAGGQPVAATARAVAALAGLPPYAAVTIAATLLVAVLQAAAGVWLGWATAGLATACRD